MNWLRQITWRPAVTMLAAYYALYLGNFGWLLSFALALATAAVSFVVIDLAVKLWSWNWYRKNGGAS